MKKLLLILLALTMCVSMCACGSGSSTTKTKTEPTLNVRQELINICCRYSKCTSVKSFQIGTKEITPISNGYKVSAKGSYFAPDEYAANYDLMTFDIEFVATWDGESNYYDIRVTKKTITSK